MRVIANYEPGSSVRGTITDDGVSENFRADIYMTAHKATPAVAGRMKSLDFAAPGAKLQADGRYALDLLAEKDARTMVFSEPDGTIGAVSITPRMQELGWPAGDYYMLAMDSTGTVVVKPGRNHRKVYITGGGHGYTRAEIAQEVGLSEAAITNIWLLSGPGLNYGTLAKPFIGDVGISFMKAITTPTSNWYLFECGYDYSTAGEATNVVALGARGESPIHPILYGFWGTGPRPTGLKAVSNGAQHYSHAVFQGLKDLEISSGSHWNWLITDVDTTKFIGASASASGADGMTIYRCILHDVFLTAPKNGRTSWSTRGDHVTATFTNNVNGFLMWQNVYDYIAWREGYNPDLLWNNGQYPQGPIALSHNAYLQWNTYDIGVFENLSARAASQGIQMRGGGYSIDNILMDNNIAGNDMGGDYKYRGPVGSWSLHLGTIITSAGYKRSDGAGGLAYGLDLNNPYLPSAVDIVIMHKADPDNPSEIAAKSGSDFDIRNSVNRGYYTLNAISYRWASTNRNIEGLNTTTLDQTTIQRYATTKLGAGNGTIKKYMEYLRTLTGAQRKTELDALRAYFRAPVQSKLTDTLPVRTAAATCTFQADDRGEGFRWDVRLNWSTKDIPGAVFKDHVNLFGNRVKFGRYTASVGDLTFGTGGKLEVSSGKLGVDNQIGIADVTVFNCGQYDAQAEAGIYRARGGCLTLRPAGAAEAFSVEVNGDAECIFGNPKATISQAVTIAAGQTLRIDGGQCHVGVDGQSNAARTLTLAGTLDIRSTPILRVANSNISPRYKQGNLLNGQTSGFGGVLDCLQFNESGWSIAVRGLTGTPLVGEQMVGQPLDTGTTGTDADDEANETDNSPTTTKRIPVVSSIWNATLPCIRKFRSGENGEAAPSVTFTVALSGPLKLDLTGVAAGTYPIIEADSVTGNFSGQTITGLAAGLTAVVTKTATAVTVVVS